MIQITQCNRNQIARFGTLSMVLFEDFKDILKVLILEVNVNNPKYLWDVPLKTLD